jgi:hypothetical protein
LEDETGAFAGVVAAVVNLEDLQSFYAATTVDGGSAVQLLRDNGQLLVRDPPNPNAIEKSFPQLSALRATPSRLTNPIDGKRDFIAVVVKNVHARGSWPKPRDDDARRVACANRDPSG